MSLSRSCVHFWSPTGIGIPWREDWGSTLVVHSFWPLFWEPSFVDHGIAVRSERSPLLPAPSLRSWLSHAFQSWLSYPSHVGLIVGRVDYCGSTPTIRRLLRDQEARLSELSPSALLCRDFGGGFHRVDLGCRLLFGKRRGTPWQLFFPGVVLILSEWSLSGMLDRLFRLWGRRMWVFSPLATLG